LAPELADVGLILQKLDWLTRNIERIADAP